MTYDLTDDVKAIGSLNFEGNITPIEWYSHLILPNNKPDLVSIILLSDIVYWYRPTTIRDEFSGKIVGYKKKFKSDLLQKSYNDLEELFGLTKDQIKKSLQRLEQLNLIKRVFRHINSQGSSLANVMFIQIFPNQISKITEKVFDMGINTHTSEHIYPGVCANKPTHPGIYTHTYTETTTNTTTNNSLSLKAKKNSNQTKQSALVKIVEKERENEMLKIWNEVVEKHFGREIKITSKRKLALKNRLKEFFDNDINSWNEFCKNILKSKFLMGEIKDFRVSLDWVLKEEFMIKVIEGTYHRGGDSKALNDADPKSQEQEIVKELQESNTPKFWQQMMKTLLEEKGAITFNAWFKKNNYLKYENGILQIKAPSRFFVQWQKDNFWDDMVKACRKNIPNFKDLEIVY